MLFVVPLLLVCAWLAWEKYALARRRAKIPLRLHVFGTRGKSGTVRALVAELRGLGLRVYGRTTGEAPESLWPDGSTRLFRRFGPARVGEYGRVIREAAGLKAEALVLECMALTPETIVAAGEMLAPGVVALTNSRPDHQESMGESPEEIAATLALGAGEGREVYLVADAGFERFGLGAEKGGGRPHRLEEDFSPPAAAARRLAQRIASDLRRREGGGAAEKAEALPTAEAEAWPAFRRFDVSGPLDFLDLFSVNDVVSSELLLRRALAQGLWPEEGGAGSAGRPPLAALLAVRDDRPLRTKAFVEWLAAQDIFDMVAVQGSHAWYGALALKRRRVSGLAPLLNPGLEPKRLLALLRRRAG
ncbi:MAG: hypothetical protein LBV70_06805, partial [Candidatus Adiutrix sp.]|nr:hypothetical protein [Candidatus Adiutrix sp.]